MRLDRYLFFIRILKSRTQAQTLIDTGRVRLDGHHVARPSEPVKVGSIIAFPLFGRIRILKVTALPTRRGPAAEARDCYADLGENVSQQASSD
nr:RNA-binding S4 domain-containing protein [uncultured Sphingomonas sp.]